MTNHAPPVTTRPSSPGIDRIQAAEWRLLSRPDPFTHDATYVTFTGKLLGEATSQRDEHTHPGVKFAPARYQCSACRFFRPRLWLPTTSVTVWTGDKETAVHALDDPNVRFVLQTSGLSLVPGEVERSSVTVQPNAPAVIRHMLVSGRSKQPYLPEASLQLLADVADIVPEFDDVYDELIEPLDRRR